MYACVLAWRSSKGVTSEVARYCTLRTIRPGTGAFGGKSELVQGGFALPTGYGRGHGSGVKKATATKLTVGTSIHGQVCENPPELTPSSIDCTKRTLSGRTDLINRRAKYSRQVSDCAPIRRQWPLTFPWSRKVPGPSVRNQWSRSFGFSENLIAPDKSSWPKHCVTLS